MLKGGKFPPFFYIRVVGSKCFVIRFSKRFQDGRDGTGNAAFFKGVGKVGKLEQREVG